MIVGISRELSSSMTKFNVFYCGIIVFFYCGIFCLK